MRRLLACSLTAMTVLACAKSSTSDGTDASAVTADDAASGVTCYNLVSAGTVSVASADACNVLASGHPGVMLPGQAPPDVIVSEVCSELCIGVHGDNFCVVAPGFVSAWTEANAPDFDAGAEAGTRDASAITCPTNDAGGVTITCYAEMPYQASACPK